MPLAIYADVQAFHEAEIGLECECGEPFTPPTTTDAVQAHQTFEIANLRRFGKI